MHCYRYQALPAAIFCLTLPPCAALMDIQQQEQVYTVHERRLVPARTSRHFGIVVLVHGTRNLSFYNSQLKPGFTM